MTDAGFGQALAVGVSAVDNGLVEVGVKPLLAKGATDFEPQRSDGFTTDLTRCPVKGGNAELDFVVKLFVVVFEDDGEGDAEPGEGTYGVTIGTDGLPEHPTCALFPFEGAGLNLHDQVEGVETGGET